MSMATGSERGSDVKSEVSSGHSRGNLKGQTLTTQVEVTTLMTNSSGPQSNVLGAAVTMQSGQNSAVSSTVKEGAASHGEVTLDES